MVASPGETTARVSIVADCRPLARAVGRSQIQGKCTIFSFGPAQIQENYILINQIKLIFSSGPKFWAGGRSQIQGDISFSEQPCGIPPIVKQPRRLLEIYL
jgi:hypothetical protein